MYLQQHLGQDLNAFGSVGWRTVCPILDRFGWWEKLSQASSDFTALQVAVSNPDVKGESLNISRLTLVSETSNRSITYRLTIGLSVLGIPKQLTASKRAVGGEDL